MKKIFTCIFAACLAVSLWGSEITIGGSSSSNHSSVPMDLSKLNSASQSIYLKSELETAGLPSDAKISKIALKYGSSNGAYTRALKIYITNTTADVATTYLSNYKFDKVTSSDLFCDTTITLPSSSGTFYTLNLSKEFVWDGTSNICIIVCDNSNSAQSSKFHKVTGSSVAGRCIYATSSVNPTSSSIYFGINCDSRPVIQFTYAGGGKVVTLEASCTDNAFGTFAKAYEVKQATIMVTGENLTENVTISAPAGLNVSPSSLTKEAVMASGGAQVTITTNSSFVNNSKVTFSANSKSSSITFTGSEAEFYQPIATSYFNSAYSSGKYYVNYNTATTISEVNTSAQQLKNFSSANFMVDYSGVPGSYAVNGKISNLYGKFISESVFKAFAFTYTAPVVSGITIAEGVDNSALLEQYNGQSVDVNFTRSFTAGMYNTICLPITIGEGILSSKFGAGYSLIELSSTTIDGNAIVLNFNTVTTSLLAGKPYFIKPTKDVVNPSFTNYVVSKEVTPKSTTYADFIPVFSPTALESSKDILFLGANNELFWPSAAGSLKGLRCYFEMKNGVSAGAPIRMSIGRGTPTSNEALDNNAPVAVKRIVDGQLIIERNGVQYDLNGKIIK